MTNRNLKNRIEAAILDGRRKLGLRQLEKVYAELGVAFPDERLQIRRSQESHFYFITKYTAIVGFYEYVERECSRARIYDRMREMIFDMVLRSIIFEHGADLRHLDKDARRRAGAAEKAESSIVGGEDPYTRRRAQDILRRAVPSEFILVGDEAEPQVPDLRLRPVRTVHAPGPLPPSDHRAIAQRALDVEEAAMEANVNWRIQKEVGAALRLLSPTYLRSLIRFRETARRSLGGVSTDTMADRERRSVLRELLLSGYTPSLVVLHHDVASQLASLWWDRRRESLRKGLLDKGFPFRLDTRRVAESAKLLLELGLDSTQVFGLLQLPAMMLLAIGQPEDAITFWRYFATCKEILPVAQGFAADNAAVLLVRQGQWKLAHPLFSRAIAAYDEAADGCRKAVVLKNRGEARLRVGARGGAGDMIESERIGDSLAPPERFAVNWNLAMARMRLKDKVALRRHLKRCLVDRDYVDPERVNLVCDLLLDPASR